MVDAMVVTEKGTKIQWKNTAIGCLVEVFYKDSGKIVSILGYEVKSLKVGNTFSYVVLDYNGSTIANIE